MHDFNHLSLSHTLPHAGLISIVWTRKRLGYDSFFYYSVSFMCILTVKIVPSSIGKGGMCSNRSLFGSNGTLDGSGGCKGWYGPGPSILNFMQCGLNVVQVDYCSIYVFFFSMIALSDCLVVMLIFLQIDLVVELVEDLLGTIQVC